MINYYDKESVDKALALLNETSELLTELASFNDASKELVEQINAFLGYNEQ